MCFHRSRNVQTFGAKAWLLWFVYVIRDNLCFVLAHSCLIHSNDRSSAICVRGVLGNTQVFLPWWSNIGPRLLPHLKMYLEVLCHFMFQSRTQDSLEQGSLDGWLLVFSFDLFQDLWDISLLRKPQICSNADGTLTSVLTFWFQSLSMHVDMASRFIIQ
jgi:hypothetical protein